MQHAITSHSLTTLEIAMLETVIYSDIFDFPLTRDEIWRWLPIEASREEVEAALESVNLSALLTKRGMYVTLRGRDDLNMTRERRRQESAALRRDAERYGRLIARLPFVRMVAITGSLAFDNAGKGADLDYLIVTAPGRVWFVRTLTMAWVRIAGLRGVTLCPNYLLAETAIALPERDPYTARELLQMVPVAGFETYRRMIEANGWWSDFLPNAVPSLPMSGKSSSRVRRAAEVLLGNRAFDRLERWLLARKGDELRRQAASDEAVFDESMCKGHFEGWRAQTHKAVAERMKLLLDGVS